MDIQSGQMISHYRLVEKVGEGGMGIVWKADDTILGRPVAIKVLPAEVVPDEVRRRMFLDEARLAASISHGNIVQVFELGRDRDLDFIVMEYIEGKPLSKILHGRPLSPDQVATWGLQLTQGLARAHQRGLIHRDLKPANILITPNGDTKIVDFGLATLFSDPDQTASMTKPLAGSVRDRSAIVGTLPYMSPEQVRGEKLDARTDVFSLGSVLYEMTTGRRPFQGTSPADIASAITGSKPEPVHQLVPRVPFDLHRIIEKAMARSPADRYQTTADMAVDLKRLLRDLDSGSSPSFEDLRARTPRAWRSRVLGIIGTILAALLVATAWWVRHDTNTSREARSIIIPPLEVLGQAEGGEYTGRAFAEAVTVDLAAAKSLRVLPVPSTGALEPGSQLVRAVKDQGIDLLLTGSIIREGRAVTVRVTLIDPSENRVLWGVREKAEDGELARIAASVSNQLAEQVGATHPKVYEYFRYVSGSKAMADWPELPEVVGALRRHDTEQGLKLTARLLAVFPNEYEAHVMRIVALVDAGWLHPTDETVRVAWAQELAAIRRVDPNTPIAVIVDTWVSGDRQKNLDLLNQLLSRDDLSPACRAHVLRERGRLYSLQGDMTKAISDLEEAVRLDPANMFNYAYYCEALFAGGRLEEALARARQAASLDPSVQDARAGIAARLGLWSEALAAYAKTLAITDTREICAAYAVALLRAGRRKEALEMAGDAGRRPESDIGSYNLGCFWAVAGDLDRARTLWRRSLELGLKLESISLAPYAVSLHGDSKSEAVLAEVIASRPRP